MTAIIRIALAVAAAAMATQAVARVSFYEQEGFEGESFTTARNISNMARLGFNDSASSAVVERDRWEVCEDARFRGRCMVLRPGKYGSLAAMGLNDRVSSARAVSRKARVADSRYAPEPVAMRDENGDAQITFYESEGFQGRSFTTEGRVADMARYGFSDRASSAVVARDRWEVCEDARFGGRCAVLRPGRYPSLAAMGLNDRVSSARIASRNSRLDEDRNGPRSDANRDYRRRDNEPLYHANVTSVRAVVGTPEQRCWVEREQIPQERSNASVPAAIAGAIIGGILGHQVGGGRGQDIATAGGAVAGAAVGANVGRDGGGTQAQVRDVQRCANVPSDARPDYWDVTYDFRGQSHRVQLSALPGPTIVVNGNGEPRD